MQLLHYKNDESKWIMSLMKSKNTDDDDTEESSEETESDEGSYYTTLKSIFPVAVVITLASTKEFLQLLKDLTSLDMLLYCK